MLGSVTGDEIRRCWSSGMRQAALVAVGGTDGVGCRGWDGRRWLPWVGWTALVAVGGVGGVGCLGWDGRRWLPWMRRMALVAMGGKSGGGTAGRWRAYIHPAAHLDVHSAAYPAAYPAARQRLSGLDRGGAGGTGVICPGPGHTAASFSGRTGGRPGRRPP